jgi:hypothetical protein
VEFLLIGDLLSDLRSLGQSVIVPGRVRMQGLTDRPDPLLSVTFCRFREVDETSKADNNRHLCNELSRVPILQFE